MSEAVAGRVVAVCTRADPSERMAKPVVPRIDLVVGTGVRDDVHSGRKRRQVAIATLEDLDGMRAEVGPIALGEMGENIVIEGVPPTLLERGARLTFASGAVLEVTQPRKPCVELDEIAPGLLAASMGRSGVFARVLTGGPLAAGDAVGLAETRVATPA